MATAQAPDISGQETPEDKLQEALQIIDEGLETADGELDIVDMEAALTALSDQLRDHPEFEELVKQGETKVVRTNVFSVLLGEGKKIAENVEEKEEGRVIMELELVLKNIRVKVEDILKTVQESQVALAPVPVTPTTAPTAATTTATPAPTPEAQPEATSVAVTTVPQMVQAVLEDSGLYSVDKDNPVSRALSKLISGLRADKLAELQSFLRQPSKGFLPPEAAQYEPKPSKELEMLIAGEEKKIKDLEVRIQDLKERRGKGTISSERTQINDDISTKLDELRNAESEKGYMEIALAHKKGSIRYKSVEQVMYMTGMWLAQDKGGDLPSELDIYNEMHALIEDKKRGGEYEEKWGLFKPRLTLILEAIADKDAHLGEIGTEKMKDLAGAWNDRGKVEVWLKNVEGTDEYKMEKVMPPLIAYLQLAVREGLSSNVPFISGKHAENLLKHLKALRHEHAKTKAAEAAGAGASAEDKMTAYFTEIARMTMSEQEINRRAITLGTGWNVMKKGGAVGLAVLGGLLWGGAKLAGSLGRMGAGAVTGTFKGTGRWLKGWSPESKAGVERGAKRAVFAGVVGAGAVAAGLALSPAALVAMPAVFAPEIWSKRREISSTVGKAGILGGAVSFAAVTMPLLLIPSYSKWIMRKHGEYAKGLDDKIYGPPRYTERPARPARKPTKLARSEGGAANDGKYKRTPEKAANDDKYKAKAKESAAADKKSDEEIDDVTAEKKAA